MRHDVDRLPKNTLILAQLEYEMDVKSSYYFRVVPSVWNENIILCMSLLIIQPITIFQSLLKAVLKNSIVKLEKKKLI